MSRLVLDTNVVLDLLHFDDVATRPLRQALDAGRVQSVVSDATLREWRRVLAYPEFGLGADAQEQLFARYRALSRHAPVAVSEGLPRCRDGDDQKFIELAVAAQATGLVSKDRHLLKMRRRCARYFRIMTPREAADWLAAPG